MAQILSNVSPGLQPPFLATERLLLESHRLEDLAASQAMWVDPEVTRFIGGRPFTPQEVWQRLLRYAGHWALLGFGNWAIRERSTGRFVGEVGLFDGKRGLRADLDDSPELGYALASWCHGRGFGTEAVRAAVAWGDAHLSARRTWCLIHPEAGASLRVADKCGYREFERTELHGQPVVLLDRARHNFP